MNSSALSQLKEPIEHHCFAVAALVRDFNRTRLSSALSLLGVRNGSVSVAKATRSKGRVQLQGRQFSATDLTPLVERWLRLGLVRASADTAGGVTHVVDAAAGGRFLLEPSLRPFLLEVERTLEAHAAAGRDPERSIRHIRHEEGVLCFTLGLRTALFLGRTELVLPMQKARGALLSGYRTPSECMDELLQVAAPAEVVRCLPDGLRESWIAWACERALRVCELPDVGLLKSLILDTSPLGATLRAQAAILLAFGPDEPWLQQVFEKETSPLAHQVRALSALRSGDWFEARQSARQACVGLSGNSKRKAKIQGPAAPLLTLVLATGDAEENAIAAEQAMSLRSGALKRVYQAIAGERHSQVTSVFFSAPTLGIGAEALLPLLFSGVFWPLSDATPGTAAHFIRVLGAQAKSLGQKLTAGRFVWLAEQAKVLEKHCANINSKASSLEASSTTSSPSLLQLLKTQAPWEYALESLERVVARAPLTSRPSEVTKNAQARLAFVLRTFRTPDAALRAANIALEPRLQKLKGSAWTEGRNVALQKLATGATDAPMTDPDRKVAAAIRMAKTWHGHEYHFSSKALLSLVGHSHVFWAESPTGPAVKVEQALPELRVERTGDSLKVGVVPEPDEFGLGVQIVGETLLLLVPFSSVQLAALQAFQALPNIPQEGLPRLSQALSGLSQLFNVQSSHDIATSSTLAQEIDADARPVVLLAQAHPGLRVTVVVEPLGPEGPSLPPGQGLANLAAQVSGQKLTCRRDLQAEVRNFQTLSTLVTELTLPRHGHAAQVQDFGVCLSLVRTLATADEAGAAIVRWPEGEPLEVLAPVDFSNLRLEIKGASEWLEISGQVRFDEGLVMSMQELIRKANVQHGFLDLGNNRFAALSDGLKQQLFAMNLLAANGGEPQLNLPMSALGFVGGWLLELKEAGRLKTNKAAEKRLASIERAYRAEPVIPPTLEAELRSYQRIGFEFLSRLAAFGAGAILADDMGLGKTLMTLALLLERAPLGPALVVSPVSVKNNWILEGQRFAPTLRFLTQDMVSTKALSPGPFDVVVSSYSVMTLSIETFEKVPWASLVLDEAQSVKNPSAQRSQAARRLHAGTRICLTGTPIENHLGDLYGLMSIVNPGLLGSAKHFEERFAKPIQREADAQAREALQAVIAPFVLRRRKSEVLRELPARTEIQIDVQPDPEEQAFLEALRREAIAKVPTGDGVGKGAIHILAEITRLRRAACHPRLVAPETNVGGAKLEALVSLVHDLRQGQHRALIFSQFVDFLSLVRDRFSTEGITHQYLDGSTPEKLRSAAVEAFQKGEGEVFLISLKAGGFGLNLTAADYVIHLDPWWNPAVEDQASDRARRIGQTRPVTIYRLICVGSIEQKVLALHARKRDLAETLLSGAERPAALDVKALYALLAGDA